MDAYSSVERAMVRSLPMTYGTILLLVRDDGLPHGAKRVRPSFHFHGPSGMRVVRICDCLCYNRHGRS
jgi:hypothetical protein